MAAATAYAVVGQPIPRVEGPDKVTGGALYTADVRLPNALHCALVASPHPHARIVSIDASGARAVAGVRAVLTAADIPNRRIGRRLKDQPLLCDDRVRFVGDSVAVVAADDPEAAEEAALLVQVEYEELPAVFDPLAAMGPDAPVIHPDARSYQGFFAEIPSDIPNVCGYRRHDRGGVDDAFRGAAHVFEHTFATQLAHQGYLEPHACAVAIRPDGRVEVWVSNKVPYNLRGELAEAIGRPETDILVHPVTVGGDFGSKGGPGQAPLAYLLARQFGRPVRFISSSHHDLVATSHRHPSLVTLRTALTREGDILAREARVIYNTGAYGSLKPNPDGMLNGVDHTDGPYRIPNLRAEGLAVYTNTPPSGYMRAPGHAQVIFAVEGHMDLLARELGMDPLEFRLRNAIQESPSGGQSVVPHLFRTAAEAIGWGRDRGGATGRQEDGETGGRGGAKTLIGRGMAIAVRGTGVGEGTSDLTVNPDGTITILTSMPDNGTGALTVVVQVVAEEFGIPVERVLLVRADTDALPTDVGSGASRMTNVAGHAAIAACEQIKRQLAPLAATMLGAQETVWEDGGWRGPDGQSVSLEALAAEMVRPGDPAAHAQVTLSQTRSPDRGYGVQAAEVAVDPETGAVRLTRFATVQDVGTIINPLGHQGQIDGGVSQGIGLALTEELVLDDGAIVNGHLGDYKLPTTGEVPELVTINVPTTGPGPFNAKAIGELPSVPGAAAIANAVADAVGAPMFHLPITAERVLAALEGKQPGELSS